MPIIFFWFICPWKFFKTYSYIALLFFPYYVLQLTCIQKPMSHYGLHSVIKMFFINHQIAFVLSSTWHIASALFSKNINRQKDKTWIVMRVMFCYSNYFSLLLFITKSFQKYKELYTLELWRKGKCMFF